jgi:hypothetical protein
MKGGTLPRVAISRTERFAKLGAHKISCGTDSKETKRQNRFIVVGTSSRNDSPSKSTVALKSEADIASEEESSEATKLWNIMSVPACADGVKASNGEKNYTASATQISAISSEEDDTNTTRESLEHMARSQYKGSNMVISSKDALCEAVKKKQVIQQDTASLGPKGFEDSEEERKFQEWYKEQKYREYYLEQKRKERKYREKKLLEQKYMERKRLEQKYLEQKYMEERHRRLRIEAELVGEYALHRTRARRSSSRDFERGNDDESEDIVSVRNPNRFSPSVLKEDRQSVGSPNNLSNDELPSRSSESFLELKRQGGIRKEDTENRKSRRISGRRFTPTEALSADGTYPPAGVFPSPPFSFPLHPPHAGPEIPQMPLPGVVSGSRLIVFSSSGQLRSEVQVVDRMGCMVRLQYPDEYVTAPLDIRTLRFQLLLP